MKTLILLLAGGCVFVSPAFAADLPSRRAPPSYAPPPISAFSWEGFYAGGQVGYAFGRDASVANVPAVAGLPFPVGPEPGDGELFAVDAVVLPPIGGDPIDGVPAASYRSSSSISGVMGGGHVGYNFSTRSFLGSLLGPSGIIGIEGDVDGLDYSKTVTGIPYGLTGADFASIRSDLQGSIRGRLGFAFDRVLLYATGGAAFGDFKTSYNLAGLGSDQFSHSRVGYTVGGGVEYALTNNIAVRVEYRYSDFGSFTDTLVNAAPVPGTTVTHRETMNRVQAGISYLFATPPAPVIARY